MTRSNFMEHIDNIATQSVEIVMDKLGRATYMEDENGLRFTSKSQEIYNDIVIMLETEIVPFGLDVANEQKEICASRQCDSIIIREIEECPTVEFKEFDSLEDTDKYKYWQENHSDMDWEEFNDNYFKCNKCGTYDDLPCMCYTR